MQHYTVAGQTKYREAKEINKANQWVGKQKAAWIAQGSIGVFSEFKNYLPTGNGKICTGVAK